MLHHFSETYIMKPGKFVSFRIGPYVTFEVNVVTFFDVFGIQTRAHFQSYDWHIWNRKGDIF